MKKALNILVSLAIVLALLALNNGVAFAQATRTWVSGVGDDANPCNRTAPCKTFAGAISKTAAGGEIDVLDPGGFGAVTITKALTIDGGPNAGGVLNAGTNGIIVNAGATDKVVLKNLDFQGTGTGLNGIRFLAGASLSLQNVNIRGNTNNGIEVFPSAGKVKVFANNVTIENNNQYGIWIHRSGTGVPVVVLNNVRVFNNGLDGVRAEASSTVIAVNSVAAGNGNDGFAVVAGIMFLESCESSGNATGGVQSNGSIAQTFINNVTITNNGIGLYKINGGLIVSFGNNKIAGNTTDGAPTSTVNLQ